MADCFDTEVVGEEMRERERERERCVPFRMPCGPRHSVFEDTRMEGGLHRYVGGGRVGGTEK